VFVVCLVEEDVLAIPSLHRLTRVRLNDTTSLRAARRVYLCRELLQHAILADAVLRAKLQGGAC
jgi:hypothetical protein